MRMRAEPDWEVLESGGSLEGSYGSRQGFTGGQDLATLGVVVLGARVYDPAFGRWMSPDPAGVSASPYGYAGDDPETLIDPSGAFSLRSLVDEITSLAAVAVASHYFGSLGGGFVQGCWPATGIRRWGWRMRL